MVTGRPFDQLRDGGWAWLVEERLDHYMAPAVADVAFIVTTHSLERRELPQARAAAEIGALAAPDEEATRLCLARVCEAEGNCGEAERILREEVCNRSDDGGLPADISHRTAQILRNHRWLTTAAPTTREPGDTRAPGKGPESDKPQGEASAASQTHTNSERIEVGPQDGQPPADG